MRPPRRLVCALVAAASSTATGCFFEPAYSLTIRAEVPVDTQRRLPSFPAEVIVRIDHEWGPFRVAILCSASDMPFIAEAKNVGICGYSRDVEVWLAPHYPRDGQVRCGPLQTPEPAFVPPPKQAELERTDELARAREHLGGTPDSLPIEPRHWPSAHATAFARFHGKGTSDCGSVDHVGLILR
jgi:hypothetical protein